jgi:hypothetical protein
MKCGRPNCLEAVAVAGDVEVYNCDNDRGGSEYVTMYKPRYFNCAPDIFRIPKNCPDKICVVIRSAFSLHWNDLGSCLNRIRIAIELMLTEMGIKRYTKKQGGGRILLSLHSRIDALRKKQPKLNSLCDALLAIKWLGNEGSHPGEVAQEDVFDALDILEHVLVDRFEKPHSVIAKMSREINRKKGSRRK